ncbi:MAG: Rieske (2Fe-2S) protein [Hyphomicrobiales bacterium]
MAEVFVGKASDLKEGERRIIKTSRGEVGLFFEDGAYHAYSNLCPHQGGPACEGIVINKVVDIIAPDRTYQGQTFSDTRHFVCPWHGWEYDLVTGECAGNRRIKLKKFDVVKKGDDIFVKV